MKKFIPWPHIRGNKDKTSFIDLLNYLEKHKQVKRDPFLDLKISDELTVLYGPMNEEELVLEAKRLTQHHD